MSKTLNALVIDDSATVQRLLELTLRPLGIHVDFAKNGEDGVSMAYGRHYDMIFLDVILPGMDGYEVCKIIKRNSRRRPTIIMLTSKSSAFDRVRGVMAGTDVYMIKPLQRDQIITVVRKYVQPDGHLPVTSIS